MTWQEQQQRFISSFLAGGQVMGECQEVASNLAIPPGPITPAQARSIVHVQVGTPAEVGYQIFDNVVDAVVARSKR